MEFSASSSSSLGSMLSCCSMASGRGGKRGRPPLGDWGPQDEGKVEVEEGEECRDGVGSLLCWPSAASNLADS